MALLRCTECQAEIPEQASACVKCGHPIRAEKPQAVKTATAIMYAWPLVGLVRLGVEQPTVQASRELMIVAAGAGFVMAWFFAFLISRGANWARVVYVVLSALGILLTLPGVPGTVSQNLPAAILDLAGAAVSGLIIALLYQGPSSAWFKGRTGRERPRTPTPAMAQSTQHRSSRSARHLRHLGLDVPQLGMWAGALTALSACATAQYSGPMGPSIQQGVELGSRLVTKAVEEEQRRQEEKRIRQQMECSVATADFHSSLSRADLDAAERALRQADDPCPSAQHDDLKAQLALRVCPAAGSAVRAALRSGTLGDLVQPTDRIKRFCGGSNTSALKPAARDSLCTASSDAMAGATEESAAILVNLAVLVCREASQVKAIKQAAALQGCAAAMKKSTAATKHFDPGFDKALGGARSKCPGATFAEARAALLKAEEAACAAHTSEAEAIIAGTSDKTDSGLELFQLQYRAACGPERVTQFEAAVLAARERRRAEYTKSVLAAKDLAQPAAMRLLLEKADIEEQWRAQAAIQAGSPLVELQEFQDLVAPTGMAAAISDGQSASYLERIKDLAERAHRDRGTWTERLQAEPALPNDKGPEVFALWMAAVTVGCQAVQSPPPANGGCLKITRPALDRYLAALRSSDPAMARRLERQTLLPEDLRQEIRTGNMCAAATDQAGKVVAEMSARPTPEAVDAAGEATSALAKLKCRLTAGLARELNGTVERAKRALEDRRERCKNVAGAVTYNLVQQDRVGTEDSLRALERVCEPQTAAAIRRKASQLATHYQQFRAKGFDQLATGAASMSEIKAAYLNVPAGSDEFQVQKAVRKQEALQRSLANRLFLVHYAASLEKYDFEKHAFPLTISGFNQVTDGNKAYVHRVLLRDGFAEEVAYQPTRYFLPMAEKEAERLRARGVTLVDVAALARPASVEELPTKWAVNVGGRLMPVNNTITRVAVMKFLALRVRLKASSGVTTHDVMSQAAEDQLSQRYKPTVSLEQVVADEAAASDRRVAEARRRRATLAARMAADEQRRDAAEKRSLEKQAAAQRKLAADAEARRAAEVRRAEADAKRKAAEDLALEQAKKTDDERQAEKSAAEAAAATASQAALAQEEDEARRRVEEERTAAEARYEAERRAEAKAAADADAARRQAEADKVADAARQRAEDERAAAEAQYDAERKAAVAAQVVAVATPDQRADGRAILTDDQPAAATPAAPIGNAPGQGPQESPPPPPPPPPAQAPAHDANEQPATGVGAPRKVATVLVGALGLPLLLTVPVGAVGAGASATGAAAVYAGTFQIEGARPYVLPGSPLVKVPAMAAMAVAAPVIVVVAIMLGLAGMGLLGAAVTSFLLSLR